MSNTSIRKRKFSDSTDDPKEDVVELKKEVGYIFLTKKKLVKITKSV